MVRPLAASIHWLPLIAASNATTDVAPETPAVVNARDRQDPVLHQRPAAFNENPIEAEAIPAALATAQVLGVDS